MRRGAMGNLPNHTSIIMIHKFTWYSSTKFSAKFSTAVPVPGYSHGIPGYERNTTCTIVLIQMYVKRLESVDVVVQPPPSN